MVNGGPYSKLGSHPFPHFESARFLQPPWCVLSFRLSAGILKQSMGARNRVGIWLSYCLTRLYQAFGIDSLPLESISGLLKSLKVPSLLVLKLFTASKVLYTNIQTLPEIKIMIEERRGIISACVSYEVVWGARVFSNGDISYMRKKLPCNLFMLRISSM